MKKNNRESFSTELYRSCLTPTAAARGAFVFSLIKAAKNLPAPTVKSSLHMIIDGENLLI
jgi:hypothetical protein